MARHPSRGGGRSAPAILLRRMTPALEVRGLEKAYGSVRALRGVDLHVGPGELFGLLGPNGAGKSTLVKIACGLVRRSEEHTSELLHANISYAVFCLKKNKRTRQIFPSSNTGAVQFPHHNDL